MTSHTVADTARLERRPLPLWSALSLLLPLIAVLAVAAANGGYFATAFGWTTLAFAWVTLIAVVLVAPRWGRLDATWVVGAALLCVFTFCSAVWAGSAGTAIDQGQRAVVYATAAAGALLLLRRRDLERWLAGLVFGATAICFYSLGTRLFADHFGGPKPDYRLFVPVGYWNALGIFAGGAALLAFGAAVMGRITVLRILAGVSLVVLLPTLYYTYSRGAWAALIAGVLVTLLYSRWRERLFVALFVFLPLPALAVWLASRPAALTDRSASIAAASHAGHRLAVELAVVALLQAGVAGAYAMFAGRVRISKGMRIGVASVVAIALLAGLAGLLRPLRLTVEDRSPHLSLVHRSADRWAEPEQPPLLVLEQRAHGALARRVERVPSPSGRRRRRGQLPALVARPSHQRLLRDRRAQPLRADARRARG